MYYQCKHCERPVHDYTNEGINEWMSLAVVLLSDETRLIGELVDERPTQKEPSGCTRSVVRALAVLCTTPTIARPSA